jgi:hypothetical protein
MPSKESKRTLSYWSKSSERDSDVSFFFLPFCKYQIKISICCLWSKAAAFSVRICQDLSAFTDKFTEYIFQPIEIEYHILVPEEQKTIFLFLLPNALRVSEKTLNE